MDRGTLVTFAGTHPSLAKDVFVAPGATIIGDVVLGPRSSVWFGTVIRGDVHAIRIGARCNIQDLTMIHVTTGRHDTVLGDDVTVGHRAIIHGAHIGERCLIGMGATVMDGVILEPYCMVGAGALVTPGTHVPSGSLVLGAPAKVRRVLTDAERDNMERSAEHYAQLAARYMSEAQYT